MGLFRSLAILVFWINLMSGMSSANQDYVEVWLTRGIYEYFIYNGSQLVNHASALEICKRLNSNLAMTATDQLHHDVRELIKETTLEEIGPPYQSFYIGLFDYNGGNSNFQWANGDLLHFISGTPMQWSKGEPNNFNNIAEDCVTMGSSALRDGYNWFDIPCDAKRSFICQRILSDVAPTVHFSTFLVTTAIILFVLCMIVATAVYHRAKITHVKLVAEPPMAPYTDTKIEKDEVKKGIGQVLSTSVRNKNAITIGNIGALLDV